MSKRTIVCLTLPRAKATGSVKSIKISTALLQVPLSKRAAIAVHDRAWHGKSVMTHEYFQVDLKVVWDGIQGDLPPVVPLKLLRKEASSR